MTNEREARIRERAYRIWESEGRPDDRDQVHWDIATRIIEEEDSGGTTVDAMDEAIADTFPASDPVARSEPTRSIESDPNRLATPIQRRRRA